MVINPGLLLCLGRTVFVTFWNVMEMTYWGGIGWILGRFLTHFGIL